MKLLLGTISLVGLGSLATDSLTAAEEGGQFITSGELQQALGPLMQLLSSLQEHQTLVSGSQQQEEQSARRQVDRSLSEGEEARNLVGIKIRSNTSSIQLGTNGDVVMERSGEGVLTVSDTLNVSQALFVRGVDVGDVLDQFASGDSINAALKFCGSTNVENGTYHHGVYEGCNDAPIGMQRIAAGNVGCFRGYSPTPKNQWVCTENDGVATSLYPLCEANECDSVMAKGFTKHGGEVESTDISVKTGDPVSATGDCSSSSYDLAEDNYWICPGNGTAAYPAHDLCTCSVSVCNDWVLIVDDAESYGTKTASFASLISGTFSQFIAVYQSGFVACTSSSTYITSTPTNNPWQACGTALHSSGAYSLELMINDEYIVEQSVWYNLPDECEDPECQTCDILCNVDFTVEEGDDVTVTWYEPSHSTSTSDNTGTLVVDIYGYGTVASR